MRKKGVSEKKVRPSLMVNHHPTRNCNFAGMLPPFFGDPQFSNALKWGQFFWNENSPNNAKMATPAELAESSGPVVDFVVESINQLVTTARLLNFHASISKTSPILFFGLFCDQIKTRILGLSGLAVSRFARGFDTRIGGALARDLGTSEGGACLCHWALRKAGWPHPRGKTCGLY